MLSPAAAAAEGSMSTSERAAQAGWMAWGASGCEAAPKSAGVGAESGEDVDTLSVIRELEEEMQEAATKLEFERAALIRDQINKLKKDAGETPLKVKRKKVRY